MTTVSIKINIKRSMFACVSKKYITYLMETVIARDERYNLTQKEEIPYSLLGL